MEDKYEEAENDLGRTVVAEVTEEDEFIGIVVADELIGTVVVEEDNCLTGTTVVEDEFGYNEEDDIGTVVEDELMGTVVVYEEEEEDGLEEE